MYYKRCTGVILVQRSAEMPEWVQWIHHSEGKTHCEECLMLDGCWFLEGNAPPCPHHPYCHCTLDPIPYTIVFGDVSFVTGWMVKPNGQIKLNTPYGGK